MGIWIRKKPMLDWAPKPNFEMVEERRSYEILGLQIWYGHRSSILTLQSTSGQNKSEANMVECKKTILCGQDCDCKSYSDGHYMAYCCMLDNRAQVDEIDKKDYQKFLIGGHK